jgi:hypothetical protein
MLALFASLGTPIDARGWLWPKAAMIGALALTARYYRPLP